MSAEGPWFLSPAWGGPGGCYQVPSALSKIQPCNLEPSLCRKVPSMAKFSGTFWHFLPTWQVGLRRPKTHPWHPDMFLSCPQWLFIFSSSNVGFILSFFFLAVRLQHQFYISNKWPLCLFMASCMTHSHWSTQDAFRHVSEARPPHQTCHRQNRITSKHLTWETLGNSLCHHACGHLRTKVILDWEKEIHCNWFTCAFHQLRIVILAHGGEKHH